MNFYSLLRVDSSKDKNIFLEPPRRGKISVDRFPCAPNPSKTYVLIIEKINK